MKKTISLILFILILMSASMLTTIDAQAASSKEIALTQDLQRFQQALETIANNCGGFSTLGWDTGDLNGDRQVSVFNEKDTNYNGIRDDNEEEFINKTFREKWTNVYTMVNPTDPTDAEAFKLFEYMLQEQLGTSISVIPDTDENGHLTGTAKIVTDILFLDPWGNPYEGMIAVGKSSHSRGVIMVRSAGEDGKFSSRLSIKTYDAEVVNKGDDAIFVVVWSDKDTSDGSCLSNIYMPTLPDDPKPPKTEAEIVQIIENDIMQSITTYGTYNDIANRLCEIFGENETVKFLTGEGITEAVAILREEGITDIEKFFSKHFFKTTMNVNGTKLDVYINTDPQTVPNSQSPSPVNTDNNSSIWIMVIGVLVIISAGAIVYIVSNRKPKPKKED